MNNPALRTVCDPVSLEELDYINSVIPEMIKIMNAEGGVGLAANQVGITKRFFIIKVNEEVKLIINPLVLDIGKTSKYEEGCLSIPGTSAETSRARYIKISYRDLNFNETVKEFTDLSAIAIQHEIDHLDGKLYVDTLQPMKKILTLNKHRDFLNKRGRK
jgi:peptide deformylase